MGRRNKRKPNNVFGWSYEENNTINESNLYFQILYLIALYRYEWKNLPDTVDERFLEFSIIRNGRCLFFNSEEFGYLTEPFSDRGQLNHYYQPILRQPYTVGTVQFPVYNEWNSVIIYNDWAYTTPFLIITEYARLLQSASVTLEVNTKQLRTPALAICQESQVETLKALFNQIEDGKPRVLGNGMLDIDNVKLWPTINTPLVDSIDAMLNYKKNIWNEAMTYLGLNNSSIEKKERMITDEVNANNNQVNMFKNIGLASRKQAANQINRMFGLEIDVEYRTMENLSYENLFNISHETLEVEKDE